MADANQPDLTNSLRTWGLWSFKSADAIESAYKNKNKLVKPAQPGRADVIAGWDGQLIFIEAKCADTSYSFDQWEPHQKAWGLAVEKVSRLPYWLYLTIGTDPASYNPEKYKPRRTWLVPRLRMLAVERLLAPYQGSLPYIAGKGYDLTLQSRKWDAVHLLAEYELKWGKGVFGLPLTHPFYKTYQPPMVDVRETWKIFTANQEKQPHGSTTDSQRSA